MSYRPLDICSWKTSLILRVTEHLPKIVIVSNTNMHSHYVFSIQFSRQQWQIPIPLAESRVSPRSTCSVASAASKWILMGKDRDQRSKSVARWIVTCREAGHQWYPKTIPSMTIFMSGKERGLAWGYAIYLKNPMWPELSSFLCNYVCWLGSIS